MNSPLSAVRASLNIIALLAFATTSPAQTPPTPTVTPARHIPPPGITLTDADRAELVAGAAALRQEIDALAPALANDAKLLARLPDVEIFHKAVDWALRYNEFFSPKEVEFARQLLTQGHERAAQLRAGKTPWLEATGLVVRGYRSKIDGSIQPYGLVVPKTAPAGENRLMVWLLGRGDKRTELAFLAERESRAPEIVPKDTLILVPYGRFCNATKFAGEVDVFEALGAVRADYRVDSARTMVAGFSMGGASTWHLATHQSGLWCAASPGAGFAETAIYTKALAPDKPPRTWWEQKLWAWYDATSYAANLFNCPTVAYSGEIDPQKQSADIMQTALAAEGLKLERFIGPNTAHAYQPDTKQALTKRLEELLAKGREVQPQEVHLTTYTLRYPESAWVRIEGMGRHWERADVRARFTDDKTIIADTKNVTALAFTAVHPKTVVLDGQHIGRLPQLSALRFVRQGDTWHLTDPDAKAPLLRKRPGLTGPIDDAFMDGFLFVRPTGQPLNPTVRDWVKAELAHATTLWRGVYRGDAPVRDDTAVNEDDIRTKNLILWGDPSSNAVLARILKQLPIKWDAKSLVFRGQTYDAGHHAPVLVFPNPLNPQHYVVLNSGIDFRGESFGTNALQTPKLPDWAVIDLREPPGPRWPGRVADAGFFDEAWK